METLLSPPAIALVLVGVGALAALLGMHRLGWRLGARWLGSESEDSSAPEIRAPAVEAMAETARDEAYWKALCPRLDLDSDPGTDVAVLAPPERVKALEAELREDGFCQIDDVLEKEEATRLAEAVCILREKGWPPPFGFLYDAFWRPFRRLGPILSALLEPGYRHLPDIWAWHLDPRGAERGWKPHRDKGCTSLMRDGRPKSLTVWIALSDSTPRNGCIYVLPAGRDPNYRADSKSLELRDLQDLQALPVPAGTALIWTQSLLHWSGRASPRSSRPRISVSCEFQRGDVPPLNEPLFDPAAPLPFELRLRLVALQLLQYAHMHGIARPLVELARSLQR
jgi:hypothetical protein